ncbi:hypothetical protein VTJ83DRAFT_66 [Remersonia thermophila]|uniref:Uncharacterized protein n=1 Tax=Remersonia thermophila TaxID=72144 RepID=A0ABR4DJZ1_9PEZI
MGLTPDPDLPPSYAEATTTSTAAALSPSLHTLDPATGLPPNSPLTLHLRALPARLQAAQRARDTAAASRAADLTTLLLPHVEAFLADVASGGADIKTAELTLVPAGAVPPGAEVSGVRERAKAGELVRVVCVEVVEGWQSEQQGGKGEEKKNSGEDATLQRVVERPFDGEWGRFDTERRAELGEDAEAPEKALWFRDEDLARRIAAYLRPEPNLQRKQVQAAVVEKKQEEKAGRWGLGLFGKSKKKEPLVAAPDGTPPGVAAKVEVDEELVKMTVKADEITLRRENEFGVWETKTGWGVVVRVKVKT